MKPPTKPKDDPDALIECDEAMEGDFIALAEKAEQAGYDPVLVARALKSLAKNYMRKLEENAETDREIDREIRRRKL